MLFFNYERCLFYFIFRLRLQNNSQEAILWVCRDENFDPKRYDRAIDIFLNEYPDGELRVGKRRLSGYTSHVRPNRSKKAIVTINIDIDDEPNLSEISSNEWSSSDLEAEI